MARMIDLWGEIYFSSVGFQSVSNHFQITDEIKELKKKTSVELENESTVTLNENIWNHFV
jgi:hypothetical protein